MPVFMSLRMTTEPTFHSFLREDGLVLLYQTHLPLMHNQGVHHTTIITWVRQIGEVLPDAYGPQTTPQVGELDELKTFVGSKKIKSGLGQQ
jgi:hypothetical protein